MILVSIIKNMRNPKDELLKEVNTAPKLMFHKLGTHSIRRSNSFENPDQPRWGWGINVLKIQRLNFFPSLMELTKEIDYMFN